MKQAERKGKRSSQANSVSTDTPQPSQVYFGKAPLETPLVPHDEDRGRRYPVRDRHLLKNLG